MEKMPKREEPQTCFGQNLRWYRKKYGHTLDAVAYSTGVSKAYLSQLENNKQHKISVTKALQIYREMAEIHNISFLDVCFTSLDTFKP